MKTRKLALIAYCAAALISNTFCKLQSDQHIKHHVGGGMRLRKGTDTPSKKMVSISHMSSDELVEHIQMAVEKKQWSAALKYIERLLNVISDPLLIADMLFLMGTIYFDMGDFAKAVIVFDDFKVKFKAHPSIEMAYYKSTLASYYLTLDAERDQTQTRQTIERADSYLAAHNHFDSFLQEVKVLRADCFRKLANHEINVCNTLLKYRGSRKAVQARLNELMTMVVPEVPELKTQIVALQDAFDLTLEGFLLPDTPVSEMKKI
jgi:outer membrane protein assembly factor BamD (BamD/ComL family)